MQDLRRIKTEDAIRHALIDLLKVKNLYHITITDICTKAQINRSTFYSHYEDFNLFLRQVINETAEGLILAVSTISTSHLDFFKRENAYKCYYKWFCHIRDHKEIFSLLLGPNGSLEFNDILLNQGIEWYNEILYPISHKFEKKIPQDVLVNYIVSAHYGLLSFYLKSDEKYSAEYMAEKMVQLTFTGAFSMLGLLSK